MGVQPTHKGEPSNALYEGGAEYSKGDLLKIIELSQEIQPLLTALLLNFSYLPKAES